jgi:hypothetical protein
LIGSTAVAAGALLVAVGVAEGGGPGGSNPTLDTLIACLNAHGVQTPATSDPVQFKTWLGQHYQSDPAVEAAFEACRPDAADGGGGGGSAPSLTELTTCLRAHGVQPPDTTDPLVLKTWLGRRYQSDPAVEAALEACAPPEKKEATSAPSLAELRACLVRAGIGVPAGVDLKEWLGRAVDQRRVKQALRTCGVTVVKKRTSSKAAKVTFRRVVFHR